MQDARGTVLNCLLCALQNARMLRRSVLTALVVGTVLVLINQGPAIFAGEVEASLGWKVPLTYCVPLLVMTWGALGNAVARLGSEWPGDEGGESGRAGTRPGAERTPGPGPLRQ